MSNSVKNIMIVGVGGQGTLLASKLLGYVLMQQGYDVKVSEVHGICLLYTSPSPRDTR